MSRHSSKEAILDAAEAIVIESGALHMTLDAVAERSGVSKGGLMYNFPSKEALLEAMMGRMVERFDRLREKIRQELPEDCCNDLMVEIRMLQGTLPDDRRLSAALLALIANQPELLDKVREDRRDRFQNKIIAKGDFKRPSILLFAALGLHLHDLLNLSLLDQQQKKELYEELFRLAGNDEEL